MEPIINKVAASPIKVINLEEILGDVRVEVFDIADHLENGFILREKAFRKVISEHDWSNLEGVHLAVTCSSDAIIPTWVYMLVASETGEVAASVRTGTKDAVHDAICSEVLRGHDWSDYEDLIVVLKGCGGRSVPPAAYAEATLGLKRVAQKVMYGEPCSSVHVWRRPKQATAGAAGAAGAQATRPEKSEPTRSATSAARPD